MGFGYRYQQMMMLITEMILLFMSLDVSGEWAHYCSNISQPFCDRECCKQECCVMDCCNHDTCCSRMEVRIDVKYILFGCAFVACFVGCTIYYKYRYRSNSRITRTIQRIGGRWRTDQVTPTTGQPSTYPPPTNATGVSPEVLNQTSQQAPASHTTFQNRGFAPPPQAPPPSYTEATHSKPWFSKPTR